MIGTSPAVIVIINSCFAVLNGLVIRTLCRSLKIEVPSVIKSLGLSIAVLIVATCVLLATESLIGLIPVFCFAVWFYLGTIEGLRFRDAATIALLQIPVVPSLVVAVMWMILIIVRTLFE